MTMIDTPDLLVAMLFQQASQELNKTEVNYHINKDYKRKY